MGTLNAAAAGTWAVDLARTQATFTARHGFGSAVPGTIAVTSGTIEVGDHGQPQRLHATLDPASIDTGNARRDSDLRGKRFLDVATYPRMEISAELIAAADGGWYAEATLHARGHEGPLRIDATADGAAAEPHLHVTATARLDLRAVGIRVPGFLVRRLVDLSVSTRLTRQS
jgi:polyisoprenoid-binding protein YceI